MFRHCRRPPTTRIESVTSATCATRRSRGRRSVGAHEDTHGGATIRMRRLPRGVHAIERCRALCLRTCKRTRVSFRAIAIFVVRRSRFRALYRGTRGRTPETGRNLVMAAGFTDSGDVCSSSSLYAPLRECLYLRNRYLNMKHHNKMSQPATAVGAAWTPRCRAREAIALSQRASGPS